MSLKFVLVLSLFLGSALSKPASNEQLDKATVNDVAANAVVAQLPSEKKPELLTAAESANDKKDNSASVQISGITTGIDAPSNEQPGENTATTTPFKPQRAGTMFARFIDDIFQIPINVLQNVAKLITSPFTQTKKDPAASP